MFDVLFFINRCVFLEERERGDVNAALSLYRFTQDSVLLFDRLFLLARLDFACGVVIATSCFISPKKTCYKLSRPCSAHVAS
jgi:hypothetical protein